MTSIFSFFPRFLPYQIQIKHFINIYFVTCKCFEFEGVQNFLLLPQCFLKPSHLKSGFCDKGLNVLLMMELVFEAVKIGVDEGENASYLYLFNPFPNKPWFLRVCSTSLLKTLREKEKLLVMSNFSFSHSVFYLLGELSAVFIKLEIVVCKLFQF